MQTNVVMESLDRLQELIASFAVSFKSSNRAIDEALNVYNAMKGDLKWA